MRYGRGFHIDKQLRHSKIISIDENDKSITLKCKCGAIFKNTEYSKIRSLLNIHCGCVSIGGKLIHGYSKVNHILHKTYRTWCGIRNRCISDRPHHFRIYKSRGITVCTRWLNSFDNFLEDMGIAPNDSEIDRIDNDKGYSPDNCRWITHRENMSNTRRKINERSVNKQ